MPLRTKVILPPWDQEVTTLTALPINQSTERSPEAYVRALLALSVDDARYRHDDGHTRCNWLVHDVMALMGVPLPRKKGWPLLAVDQIDAAKRGLFGLTTLAGHPSAIEHANLGMPTFGGLVEDPHSHVFAVLPQPPTVKVYEVLIVQAGVTNFYGKPLAYSIPRNRQGELVWFGSP